MSIEITIKEVQETIVGHRSIYLSNETAVRDHLINPILNKLGWNTRSPRFVLPNAPSDDGKIPDYVLMKNGKKMLVVEAKNMSVELSDSKTINQIASYCYNPGIKFGVLTNGVKWLLFNTFQANPNERIVWMTDLYKDKIEDVVKKLSCISYENIEQIEQSSSAIYKDEILEKTWDVLIKDRNKMIDVLLSQIQQELRNDHPTIVLDTEKIRSFINIKLENLFDAQENIIERQDYDDDDDEEEDKNHVTEINNENDKSRRHKKSKIRVKIRVIFPDGVEIYHNKVVYTFVETIQKIGADKIKKLNLLLNGIPLISDKKDDFYGKSQKSISPNFFIMTHSSTPGKIKCLHEINERLNIGMKIEETEITY